MVNGELSMFQIERFIEECQAAVREFDALSNFRGAAAPGRSETPTVLIQAADARRNAAIET